MQITQCLAFLAINSVLVNDDSHNACHIAQGSNNIHLVEVISVRIRTFRY